MLAGPSNHPSGAPRMVETIEVICPAEILAFDRSLFLAGGITNCPDWQRDFVELLQGTDLLLLNPRRPSFTRRAGMADEQIEWEQRGLSGAKAISFWFPKEWLCPSTLFELGSWSMTEKTLFVGVDPDYPRREDVEIQLRLRRPEIKVVHSLFELAEQIRGWAGKVGEAG